MKLQRIGRWSRCALTVEGAAAAIESVWSDVEWGQDVQSMSPGASSSPACWSLHAHAKETERVSRENCGSRGVALSCGVVEGVSVLGRATRVMNVMNVFCESSRRPPVEPGAGYLRLSLSLRSETET